VIVLETGRLKLRELTADDAAFIMELVNEPGWLRFIGDRNVHSLDDARGYIAKGPVASYEMHGFGLWAVDLAASGEPLGMCGLVRRATLEHVDLGFAFLSRHWGRGYAREAAAAVVTLARERYRLAKLVAITDVDNLASQKVLASVGFLYDKPVHMDDTDETLSLYALDLAAAPARPGLDAP
jgi:ribosomal-protein-alanine N-acetyltransferase